MIYNIDYTATSPVTIVSVKGYPTDEAATNAKQNDNVARCIARTAGDLASLNDDVLIALAEYKAKKGQTIEPNAEAIWAVLNPSKPAKDKTPKPEKNSGEKDLPNDTKDVTSSASGDGAAQKGTKMKAKAKKKVAKKKVAAKKTATKKSTGPRGEKTLKVKSLLERKNGCTRADILEATGWPSVSVQAMAKATGLKLRKTKEKGEATRYYGS